MCTRMFSMTDLALTNLKLVDANCIQPCLIFGGQSKLYLKRKEINIEQIDSLLSLELNEKNKSSYFENSIF